MNDVEVDWLKRWAEHAPHNIALQCADTGRQFSYLDFYEQSNELAFYLKEKFQIEKKTRIAILANNAIEFFPLFFALQRLGAILVPINFRLTAFEVSQILSDCSPEVIIYGQEFQALLNKIDKKILPKKRLLFTELQNFLCAAGTKKKRVPFMGDFLDICMILYTSGTTGVPKGVMITHKMLFWNSVTTSLRLDLRQDDCTVSFLPFFHTAAWNVLNLPFLHKGAKIIFVQKFDPNRVLQICEQEKVSILFGVPTTLNMMAQAEKFKNANLSSIRFAVVGGESMPIALIEAWQAKNISIRQGYGLTEFGPNVFSLNAEHSIKKIGSIGFPNFYINVKVVNEQGDTVIADEVGELLLQGPMCMPGYWNHEQATQAVLRDGWLHTGDLVKFDQDGFFYIVGRKKEMFISGAENVYPAEIERVLSSHPKILEVAVIGVPDPKWGEVGKAFIVKKQRENVSDQEIFDFCTQHLAKFKIPKTIEFLDELPKGHSGKIIKKLLLTHNAV